MVKWLAHKWVLIRGWRFVGDLPPVPKMIIVGAPHTTNWDFVIFLAALFHYRLRVKFLGKHTLFRRPFGAFFERLGGIPVDRSRASGVVGQVVSAFDDSEEMVLVMAPEGTRGSGRWWKSGFLKIAQGASVPIVFAGIDYPTMTVTLGSGIRFDGDAAAFMEVAREFYRDKRGLHPELKTPVTLREELKGS